MARGSYYHDPARKHIEQYQDFSGGLNSTAANDNISPSELTLLENVDLGDRGSLKRRKGYKSTPNENADGIAQGLFRYHRRYAPYNLLGVEGSFEGAKQVLQNNQVKIGAWEAYNLKNEDASVYKVDREAAAHFIVNGSFEEDGLGWDFNHEDVFVSESGLAYAGSKVLRLFMAAGSKDTARIAYQTTWHDTSEGEEYYLEMRYRLSPPSIADGAPQRVQLSARIEREDGRMATYSVAAYEKRGDIRNEWVTLKGYVKMPPGAKRVKFGPNIYEPRTLDYSVGIYVDSVYVRQEIAGSENSAIGISKLNDDTSTLGHLGLRFNGLKPNAYYIYVVDYKSDGVGKGRLAIRDERFGVWGSNGDSDLVMSKSIDSQETEWTTQFMGFRTYDNMTTARAYVYNITPVGTASTVFYDNARIYEVTADFYNDILFVTNEEVEKLFPYRVGRLKNELSVETVTVIGGKFFIDGVEKPIEGDWPIQSERPIEAVTYGDDLYIATGSGLFVYNGSTISKVQPYIPDPLEELYIGTNALEDTPFRISDEIQSVVELKRIQFSRRYGVTNEFITIMVGVGKPGSTKLEYKFERRNVLDKQDYWFTIRDWDTDSTATFITDIAGEFQFKISVREEGKEVTLDDYFIPKYIIKPTEEVGDIPIDANTIHQCNRIMLHWDRILLYGDEAKPDVIYISDLFNPTFFPVNNTLQFVNPRKERITSIVRYRDNLVVFTPSSIQALYGTNPENYERIMLNPTIGCIADRAAQVVKNHVIFLSYEGIALLKAVGTSETRANVELIDQKVKDHVYYDENAVAYVRNNQYHIVYPDRQEQLRFYFEYGVWTKDKSHSLDMVRTIIEDGKLMALGSDGRIIEDGVDYYDEGQPFNVKIGTKLYDFNEPYAIKKPKELQVMFDELKENTNINVIVDTDTSNITTKTIELSSLDTIYKLIIAGKGLAVRVQIEHDENKPLKLVGFGFIFKLKNP